MPPLARRIASRLAHASAAFVLTLGTYARTVDAQAVGTLRFDVAGALAFTSPYGPADVGVLHGTFLSLPGAPHANLPVDLFCDDLLHFVTFDPLGWDVYLTNLGGMPTLDDTRQGLRYGASTPDALTRYRKAAWLVSQLPTVSTLTDTAGIQGAVWRQFESSLAPYSYANAGEQVAVETWMGAVDTFAASADWNTFDWSRFTVVTDVDAAGVGDGPGGYQEFITTSSLSTTTPEPATFVLVAGGLALVGGVGMRRRRTVDATDAAPRGASA